MRYRAHSSLSYFKIFGLKKTIQWIVFSRAQKSENELDPVDSFFSSNNQSFYRNLIF